MNLDAYLARIGIHDRPAPTLANLRRLHMHHLLAVPFENLDIPLGVPITTDPDAAVEKIVVRGRGGFCYELNGAFARLLNALGYRTSFLAARVFGADGKPGIPYDHMLLRVDLPRPYIADVGFGDSFIEPLPFNAEIHTQRHVQYRLQTTTEGIVLQQRLPDDAWRNQFIFSLTPHEPEDYAEACTYQQTSPDSHFRKKTVCSRLTHAGRVTLTADRLIVTADRERREKPVTDPARYRKLLADHFHIRLDASADMAALMRLQRA